MPLARLAARGGGLRLVLRVVVRARQRALAAWQRWVLTLGQQPRHGGKFEPQGALQQADSDLALMGHPNAFPYSKRTQSDCFSASDWTIMQSLRVETLRHTNDTIALKPGKCGTWQWQWINSQRTQRTCMF